MSNEEEKEIKVLEEVKESGYEESVTDFFKRIRNVPNFMLSEGDKVRLLEEMGEKPEKVHPLREFSAVSRYKSVFRAIRRGHVSVDGQKFPDRPFNNRKDRKLQSKKKLIYNDYKRYLASNA